MNIQSGILLPVARIFMLIAAAVAFCACLYGLALAVMNYSSSVRSQKLPPEGHAGIDAGDASTTLDAVRLGVTYTIAPGARSVSVGDTIISFRSREANPIRSMKVLAGPNSADFSVSKQDEAGTRYKVLAAQGLIDDLAKDGSERNYNIALVIATENGLSATARFPYQVPAAPEGPGTRAANGAEPSPRTFGTDEKAAEALALIMYPNQNASPDFYNAYPRFKTEIDQCNAPTEDFALEVKARVEALAPQIKADKTFDNDTAVDFIDGLCKLYTSSISTADEQNRERAARAAEAQIRAQTYQAKAELALMWAGGAFGVFLLMMPLLSLLAIEDHLRAIRASSKPL